MPIFISDLAKIGRFRMFCSAIILFTFTADTELPIITLLPHGCAGVDRACCPAVIIIRHWISTEPAAFDLHANTCSNAFALSQLISGCTITRRCLTFSIHTLTAYPTGHFLCTCISMNTAIIYIVLRTLFFARHGIDRDMRSCRTIKCNAVTIFEFISRNTGTCHTCPFLTAAFFPTGSAITIFI